MAEKLQKMLKEMGGRVDIHVQRRDYGYMLGDRTVKNKEDAIRQAKQNWNQLMKDSAKDNETTRERWTGDYFYGHPYVITVMPKDVMKGTVMFEDFGSMPEDFRFVVKGEGLDE